jgi:cardiolipin synthase
MSGIVPASSPSNLSSRSDSVETYCTLPNALSLSRLLLGLCFAWLPFSWYLPAVVLAAVSDVLDGAAGRMLGACSRLGQLLDPLADKVFVAGVVTALLWHGLVSPVEVLLIGLRDVTVILGTPLVLLIRPTVVHRLLPTWLGKATTAGQFVFFVVLLMLPEHRWAVLTVTALLSALAAGDYVRRFVRQGGQEGSHVSQS